MLNMRTLDVYGRIWNNPIWDKCPVCGQPDNCGDCNHEKLGLQDVLELDGYDPEEKPSVHFGIRPVHCAQTTKMLRAPKLIKG